MKKVWDFLKNFVIIAYILLIIFITICLLSYNNYKVTVFGKNTFLPIIDEDLEPDYKYGDLLIIKRNNLSSVKEGDVVFFYRTVAGVTTVNYATVVSNERVTDTETTFTIKDGFAFSSSYFIGKADTAVIIPKVGKVIGLLESKWGFLFLGVLPSLIAFLFTIRSVISEVRGDDEENATNNSNSENHQQDKKEEVNIEGKKIEGKEKNIENENNIETIQEEKDDLNGLDKILTEEKTNEKNSDSNIENGIENNKETDKETDRKETSEIENKQSDINKESDTSTKQNESSNVEKKNIKDMTEEEKKALIQAKLNSMTEEQKKALIQAKLNSMTEEEKKALIEAKRKKSNQ